MRQSGGPTKNGDAKHEFIVRADGSVVSKVRYEGIFRSDFNSVHLYPGDSIIVPENFNIGSLLRGMRDIGSVFSQFGLGAAAINVLR